MYIKLPSVPESLDRLRLGCQVLVLTVFHIPFIYEGLEVRAVFYAVRRVYINHLHLPGHAFFFNERVHDKQRIPGDEAVAPSMLVLVEIYGVTKRRVFVLGLEK